MRTMLQSFGVAVWLLWLPLLACGEENSVQTPLIAATLLGKEIDLNKLVDSAQVEEQRKKLAPSEFEKWLREHQAQRLFDTVKFQVRQDWIAREKPSPTDQELDQLFQTGYEEHPEKFVTTNEEERKKVALHLFMRRTVSMEYRDARAMWQRYGGRVGISAFGAYESFEGRNVILKEYIDRGDLKFASDEWRQGFLKRMEDTRVQDVLLSAERTREMFDGPTPWETWLASLEETRSRTMVSIDGADFRINGDLTYAGRRWNDQRIEGLLLNSRMVQATFDDLNPQTRGMWAYPDTGVWDADRNLREFLAAMPIWRQHGLLAITVNFQGGSPQGYSKSQPWHNSAFTDTGELRPDYAHRMQQVIEKADELGMIVILGYFYFGQDQRLKDEGAVIAATENATRWVLDQRFGNVLIEVNNECDVAAYDHDILKPARVHELIEKVKATRRFGRRLLVGTSYGGGAIPRENVVRASDFLLLHGNGVKDPIRIVEMVQQTRAVPGYRQMPILFNEDDHFDFDKPNNNFHSAIREHASWGFFDYRMQGDGPSDGYQSVPVDWGIESKRKRGFFTLLSEITGQSPSK